MISEEDVKVSISHVYNELGLPEAEEIGPENIVLTFEIKSNPRALSRTWFVEEAGTLYIRVYDESLESGLKTIAAQMVRKTIRTSDTFFGRYNFLHQLFPVVCVLKLVCTWTLLWSQLPNLCKVCMIPQAPTSIGTALTPLTKPVSLLTTTALCWPTY